MKIRMRNLLFLLAAIGLTGCLEMKEEFFVNPDMSGKVVYESKQPMMAGLMGGGAQTDPKEKAKDEVIKIIEKSAGIETWKDVSYEVTDDGKLHFKGTAYFKDFSKVNIEGGGNNKNDFVIKKTEDGMKVVLVTKKEEGEKPATKLTPEQIKEQAIKKKLEYQQSKMMTSMILGGLRMESTYHLPGKIDTAKVFKKVDDNTIQIVFEGAKMMKAMDELAEDDKYWEKQVTAGDDEPQMELLLEKMFGSPGPVEAAAKGPLKPLFDYKQEVAEAKKAFPAMRKKLGLPEPVKVVPAATGGELKNVRVGGVRFVRESDQKNQVRPFNWDKGYTLAIIADLPGAVLSVKDAILTRAVADNGEDLLPARDWDRKISFPRLSKNNAIVVLEAKMNPPSDKARGIKELAGELTYVSSAGIKKIDLGMLKLAAGTKGAAFEAEIKSIGDSRWRKGSQELKLFLRAKPEQIKSITFLDADGKALDVKDGGRFSTSGSVTYTKTMEGTFPPQAKIVVEMHDNLKEYKTVFSVKNIDLVGNPME